MEYQVLKNTGQITATEPGVNSLKLSITLLVILSSVSFFNIAFLPEDFIKILQIGAIGLIGIIILFQLIYWKINLGNMSFSIPIILIFTGVFLSMWMAYSAHDQGFLISLWAQHFMYFFLFYFVLHILQLPTKTLETILLYGGIIYALFYIIQYLAYPKEIFDVRQSLERGTIRIFLPGLAIMNLAYFIALTRIIYNNAFKYIPYIFLFLSIYILTGTRSIIAGPAIVTLVVLVFSNKIKSRSLIIFFIFLAIGSIYVMFQDIINDLVSLSTEQSSYNTDNIRFQSAQFFLTDFFPNKAAYITGNGVGHQASPFGRAILSYKLHYDYYQADIGFIGEYTKYGAFFLLGAVSLLYKGIFSQTKPTIKYARYFFILVLISLPLGQFFTVSDNIITICILMYIIDINRTQPSKDKHRPIVYFEELENKSEISAPKEEQKTTGV